jgi:hypothetical protein
VPLHRSQLPGSGGRPHGPGAVRFPLSSPMTFLSGAWWAVGDPWRARRTDHQHSARAPWDSGCPRASQERYRSASAGSRIRPMGEWFSIEVLNRATSALSWCEAYGDLLIGLALSHGATEWDWQHHPWGHVLEMEFPDEANWDDFRALSAVIAALDAVPDPVNGLLVHRGRGGSSGARWPRRPRPRRGSGAASLPLPEMTGTDEELVAPAGRGSGASQRASMALASS